MSSGATVSPALATALVGAERPQRPVGRAAVRSAAAIRRRVSQQNGAQTAAPRRVLKFARRPPARRKLTQRQVRTAHVRFSKCGAKTPASVRTTPRA